MKMKRKLSPEEIEQVIGGQKIQYRNDFAELEYLVCDCGCDDFGPQGWRREGYVFLCNNCFKEHIMDRGGNWI